MTTEMTYSESAKGVTCSKERYGRSETTAPAWPTSSPRWATTTLTMPTLCSSGWATESGDRPGMETGEQDMTYRIRIVHHDDYEVHGATGWGEPLDSEYERETLEKFESGEWDVYGTIVERECGECGTWQVVDSLWGSVADSGAIGTYDEPWQILVPYVRGIAADMLDEARAGA